jgi:hypothetical protein
MNIAPASMAVLHAWLQVAVDVLLQLC